MQSVKRVNREPLFSPLSDGSPPPSRRVRPVPGNISDCGTGSWYSWDVAPSLPCDGSHPRRHGDDLHDRWLDSRSIGRIFNVGLVLLVIVRFSRLKRPEGGKIKCYFFYSVDDHCDVYFSRNTTTFHIPYCSNKINLFNKKK